LLGFPDVAQTRLKFLLGMPIEEIIDTEHDIKSEVKSRLSGMNSLELG
jgi:hypothetical protein